MPNYTHSEDVEVYPRCRLPRPGRNQAKTTEYVSTTARCMRYHVICNEALSAWNPVRRRTCFELAAAHQISLTPERDNHRTVWILTSLIGSYLLLNLIAGKIDDISDQARGRGCVDQARQLRPCAPGNSLPQLTGAECRDIRISKCADAGVHFGSDPSTTARARGHGQPMRPDASCKIIARSIYDNDYDYITSERVLSVWQ